MYNTKVHFRFLKQSVGATKTKNTQIRITDRPVQLRTGHNMTAPLETTELLKHYCCITSSSDRNESQAGMYVADPLSLV